MKIYNYILVRLQLFILSPIFPFLLSLILFLILRSFDSTILCDAKSLDELKESLCKETFEYKETIKEYEN
jgi:hypothetical protein